MSTNLAASYYLALYIRPSLASLRYKTHSLQNAFSNIFNIVCFLLGNSAASEFYMPTFRNTLFHLHTYPPMKMEQTECSETSAYKIQTPWNYPEESIQHSEHGESLKSRIFNIYCGCRLKMHWRLSDHSVAFSGNLYTKYFQLCFRNVHVCYEFLCLHVSVIYSQGATSYIRRPEKLILLLCLP